MRYTVYVLLMLFIQGCIEEIPVQTELQSSIPINEVLVVEATLTDEFKYQQVLLSRGASFSEELTASSEQNAQVWVTDNLGNSYSFLEETPGNYVSNTIFQARQGVDYQLFITTSDGIEYESGTSQINGTSVIDDIYAERLISDNEVEGMSIFVDSSNPEGNLNEYRYTYEETYKIIAPNWTAFEFEIIQETLEFTEEGAPIYPDVTLVPRQQEERVCYNTVASNSIILSNGTSLEGNRINRNQVRFINRDNTILSHRYSILVKQLLQTAEAANFYRTLLQFSQNENIFSQIQPGFIEGNINAITGDDNLVIGLFNVASVTERRLFFNYEDFFPGEELPPYFDGLNCSTPFSPPLGDPSKDGPYSMDECGLPRELNDYVKFEEIEFFEDNTVPPPLCQGPYLVTQRACGDCTVFGSNVVPEFWIE